MGRDMKTQSIPLTDDLQLLRGALAALTAPEGRAEQVMERDFVSLPAWFSAAQAAKVLRQTGKSYALFGGERLATAEQLEGGGAKSAASCALPLGPAITVDTSLSQAWAVMERHRLDRLPVALGRVLVGIVTRETLADRLPAPGDRRLAA